MRESLKLASVEDLDKSLDKIDWFDRWFGIKRFPFKSEPEAFAYNKYLNPSRRDNYGIPGTD